MPASKKMIETPVYLDYNATTPCHPDVVAAMLPFFTKWYGNAASNNHSYGWQAAEGVTIAREQVAALINARPEEIVFTSGATEAINLAIKGVYEAYAFKGNHIITVATEHRAVLDTCAHLEKKGAVVTYLPVQADGLINTEDLKACITPATILIAVLFANNETGVVQDIKAIGKIAKENEVLFFCDAVQAAGKIRTDVLDLGIDLLAMSAHKIYGPKGVGALYVRRKDPRVKLIAQLDGGGHEKGLRSGTLNVPAIAGMGKACAIAVKEMHVAAERMRLLRNRLETLLLEGLKDCVVNGNTVNRLPHVSNISFKGVDGGRLLNGLVAYTAVSSGSACTSALPKPSHVLLAMGVEEDLAKASLRFSVGWFTSAEEINFVAEKTIALVKQLRGE